MIHNQSQTLTGVINSIEDVKLHEKKGSRLRFTLHMTQAMSSAPIEELELSARPYNILKRAGYNSVGELVSSLSAGRELKEIRNCGIKSVREIMEHLFLYQYYSLPENRREEYLLEIVKINNQR